MTIEEAIKIREAVVEWRERCEQAGSYLVSLEYSVEQTTEADRVLVEHAKRTTWQPIETLTTNADDVFLCRKNGIHVTNAVYISSDKEWVVVSRHSHDDTIHNPAKQYDFWMPAINPPKEAK